MAFSFSVVCAGTGGMWCSDGMLDAGEASVKLSWLIFPPPLSPLPVSLAWLTEAVKENPPDALYRGGCRWKGRWGRRGRRGEKWTGEKKGRQWKERTGGE